MARDGFDDFDFYMPANWSNTEAGLWNDLGVSDTTAQALYHEGYFNQDLDSNSRVAIREALDAYMWDEYGIDFSESFDWETWRESYGEAA